VCLLRFDPVALAVLPGLPAVPEFGAVDWAADFGSLCVLHLAISHGFTAT